MGFWHTGYMEFHDQASEGIGAALEPRPPSYQCGTCGIRFSSERDLRVHAFEGHPVQRPVLVLQGRECGRSRLTVTRETAASDWVISEADAATLNGVETLLPAIGEVLSRTRHGVVDVSLANSDFKQDFQFEFALADAADLDGVDAALDRLIGGGELSLRSIDDFIMRSKPHRTASRYLSGLANYLYGVLAREGAEESGLSESEDDGRGYQAKYDQAVGILGTFDRPPAEAICGIVAFHYNQFDRAMTKTKSQRVADVSLRLQSMLKDQSWSPAGFMASPHSSLDVALSDSTIEQVLEWSALPLDGTATSNILDMVDTVSVQRPSDAFKIHLIAAEHWLVAGNEPAAAHHAELLRHGRSTELWYQSFRRRLEERGPVSDD